MNFNTKALRGIGKEKVLLIIYSHESIAHLSISLNLTARKIKGVKMTVARLLSDGLCVNGIPVKNIIRSSASNKEIAYCYKIPVAEVELAKTYVAGLIETQRI